MRVAPSHFWLLDACRAKHGYRSRSRDRSGVPGPLAVTGAAAARRSRKAPQRRSLACLDGSQTIISLSASAHPSLWTASRTYRANCFLLLDRSNLHSIAHAKEIAMYWQLTKLKELRAVTPGAKRKLAEQDLQFIGGPTLTQESQADVCKLHVQS
ncbi:hypothetical protein AK812_SmicGene25807 [Symbiodinium microadriaticum]|uniref:Uncharacterized protein n=1 Tax=Symbiodinium microadriaticum TaxID=2951 RepID=A0A1Q9DBB2_SYMMI|nr:hypothetical protein AK812_SmicGene25807 [Symbiodinium microadriaticum]CAE7930116.1 unnamed protein product [Symbiodinium sp. KB8]